MINKFIDFINNAHTAFQAVELSANELRENGYQELELSSKWDIQKGGKYYVTKSDASIIAFQVGSKLENPSIQIVASHNDSPMFKIKPNGIITNPTYTKTNTEIYGGPIYSTWLDRPLGISGRVTINEDGVIKTQNVTLNSTVVIPNLPIHLNREMNSGYAYNPQIDLQALLSLEPTNIHEMLEKELGIKNVVDYDLFLYNKESACIAGAKNELILGPRLDNLECHFTSLQAFLEASNPNNINVWVSFDHEEVGSNSNHAAGSTFLIDVIDEILNSLNLGENRLSILNNTMTISADNAHAIHPNRPEKSDNMNHVYMNKGIVIKYNSSNSYTSDGISAGIFKSLCSDLEVSYQVYTNRSDIRGGGTLGSILLRSLSAISVDIGLAQLAMHSSYETAGSKDLEMMKEVLKGFYNKHLNVKNTKNITLK